MTRKSVYRSKKTDVEKARTLLSIPSDLFEKVSKLAVEVYGVQRGSLSYAVEEGLRLWLTQYSGTLISAHQNPRVPIRDIYNRVISEIEGCTAGMIPTTLPTSHLMAAVMRALNVKERSAASWIFRFYVDGLVKVLVPPRTKIFKSSEVTNVKVWELVAKEA